jgi:diguanylate cyclase (GGDEF)-like protein
LSPNRFLKSVMRRLRVSWREQPTQRDIEALEENVLRVGLVIRFRWFLVAALAAFSLAAGLLYSIDPAIPRMVLFSNMLIPAGALVFVLAYNTYYQLTYRYLGNISILNHAQLLFDILVITVLVHYSGGVYSWFYTMYALIVLEAAFIFPRPRDTWFVAGVAAVSYAAVVAAEYFDVMRHIAMPYTTSGLEHTAAYASVRILWMLTILSGTALVSLFMMSRVHAREEELSSLAMRDEATGLANRPYFQRQLEAELARARIYGRGLAVLILDVDDFAAFNKRFGLRAGNRVVRELADLLRREVCEQRDSPVAPLDVVCRYGGEEFGVIVLHPPGLSMEEAAEQAAALGDRLREKVGELRVDDMGVTVSVGLAVFPRDGLTAADLVASADQAVFLAASAGGNRLGTSDGPPAVPGLAL